MENDDNLYYIDVLESVETIVYSLTRLMSTMMTRRQTIVMTIILPVGWPEPGFSVLAGMLEGPSVVSVLYPSVVVVVWVVVVLAVGAGFVGLVGCVQVFLSVARFMLSGQTHTEPP